ncbi:hypothetical protein [Gracilibacillus massiliensis]|uniref:hypothetical protein n=1 Tax=Gracilibacillus massiliensis TaxID=1564956 RepID=UPI00071DF0E3|nr:hypothetical protein [Gracilibacillus massiliensis]
MLQRMKGIGWKKLVIYFVFSVVCIVIIGFSIVFGALLLLDKFDTRYEEPEVEETMGKKHVDDQNRSDLLELDDFPFSKTENHLLLHHF